MTALREEGSAVSGKINKGLVENMEREGVKPIGESVGVDAGVEVLS